MAEEEKPKVDWIKYGFKNVGHQDRHEWQREDFEWFSFREESGFISVFVSFEYCVSEGEIPATNQSVVLLLKAFNKPKLS